MGILSRLRGGSEDRSKSKTRFRSKEREASAKAKAKKDLKRAKRAARERAARARARAAAGAREVGERSAEAIREAGESRRTAGNVEAPDTTEEVFRNAGKSAQLRSPVDATLDPSPDGPMNERLATGMSFSGDVSGGGDSPEETGALMDPGFVTGEEAPFHDDNGTGDDEDVEENPLEFSDDFLNSGGSF